MLLLLLLKLLLQVLPLPLPLLMSLAVHCFIKLVEHRDEITRIQSFRQRLHTPPPSTPWGSTTMHHLC